MRVRVLGPVVVDGDAVALGPRDRVTLGVLVLRADSVVRTDTLAEALWGEEPPPSAAKVVQGCVVRLRRALGAGAIETVPHNGYRLRLHHDDVDVTVFEDLVTRARDLLAGGQPDRACYAVDRALALWRGDPFPDLVDWDPAAASRERLVEIRRDAQEVRVEAVLATGGHAEVLADLHRLVAEEPTRERRWVLLALAQSRCGRQADALDTVRRARRHLVDELGLDPGAELTALEAAVLRQDPSLRAPTRTVTVPECPYPGLLPFDVDDAGSFFGREADVAAALRTVDRTGTLVVVGPSGSGKSSLLRAGVAAALRRDGRRVHVLTPGREPRTTWAGVRARPGDVVVVDQLEEAFEADAVDPTGFAEELGRFAEGGGDLVLGVRGDRLGELAGHPALARIAETSLFLLGPMTATDLSRAITGPAEQAGLVLEAGLVDLLVREVEGEPAALPLVSHVLRETWAVREGRTLTVAGYRSTGGVRGAVGRSAETLFHELDAADQRLLQQLMTRLVSTGDVNAPVRRRVPRRSVDQDERRHALVERLIAARLLSSDGEELEIAHEALTVAWPRLRSWLDDDVDGLRTMRHLAVAAESWHQLGRPPSELYRGVRLARANDWRRRVGPDLAAVEADFLDASTALAEAEEHAAEEQARRERRANRRLRAGLAASVLLALVATTAGVLASAASRRADAAALAADARRLGAEALRARDLDTALLLAVAGHRLDESPDTWSNLLATLDRAPTLVRSARTPRIISHAVHPSTGTVLAQAPEEGLLVRRADSLAPVAVRPDLRGPAVVVAPDGSASVVTVMPELAAAGRPVVLLDAAHRVAAEQLGGMPEGRIAQQDVTISPDSRWLAVTLLEEQAEAPRVVGVWDLDARSRPRAVLDVGAAWHLPVVEPGGRWLWSSGDGVLRRTSLTGETQPRELRPADLDVAWLDDAKAISPDGSTLAVAAGNQVVLLDPGTGRVRKVLQAPGGVGRLAFSSDGSRLAAAGDSVTVWALGGVEPTELLSETDGGDWPAFDADGRTLHTSVFEGRLLAWDLSGERGFLPRVPGAGAAPGDLLRFSHDGTRVVTARGGPTPTFTISDVVSGQNRKPVDLRQDMTTWLDVAWSPDGALVSVPTGDDVVSVWDSRTLTQLARRSMPEGEAVAYAAFTADGALLAGTTTGRVHVLDQRTLVPRRQPIDVAPAVGDEPAAAVASIAVRPGTSQALAEGPGGRRVLVDVAAGTAEPFDLDVVPFSVAWSPDGRRLAVTTRDGGVGLYDVVERRWLMRVSTRHPFPGWDLVFAPDGSEWATLASGRVGRWDGRTGAFLGAATVGAGGAVSYDVDGRAIVVALDTGAVRRWDLDPQAWVRTACTMAGRELSEAEWRDHLPDRDFQPVCGGGSG